LTSTVTNIMKNFRSVIKKRRNTFQQSIQKNNFGFSFYHNDSSGTAHDEDHSWKSTPKVLHANEEWIKKSWGNFYSINEQRAAYKREYDALPKSYDRYGGTGKSIIAGVNYAATTTFDYEALTLGTTIFAVQNIVGYTSRFVNHAMFVPKGRYNNLWNPKKWRL
ncbi:hypothetical protein, partial [Leptospira santarosai]